VIAVQSALSVREACLLGVVQGLTEFLPVSSSGHLAVVQHFLTPMAAEQKVAIDVALHMGTLAAVILYFRRELLEMAKTLVGGRSGGWARTWIGLLVVGTLPAAAVGLPLKHRIESAFESLPVIGACFILTGIFLFLASAVRGALRTEEKLGARDALVVGLFQAFALFPGVSRSGSTISGALFRRTRVDVAAKFSFLLAIPAIAGAVLTEAKTLGALAPTERGPLVIGVLVSGITGFLAIAALLRLVREGKLRWFAYYCWILGLTVLVGATVFGRA
jgi:undecaprenyl-diphosphatase